MPAAHGAALSSAQLKSTPEDFVVEEQPNWQPHGDGEHDVLWIEKRDANTRWVAEQLASFAQCHPRDVGFAGLKDRFALTRQWFSVHRPGRSIDWSTFQASGVRILTHAVHNRKLRVGALTGNRFEILLRDVSADREQLGARFALLEQYGIPNYFGAQRFGREQSNLRMALRLARRQRLKRAQKTFALSAARAAIFNATLARRVAADQWRTPIDGDLLMLSGSHSFFAFDEHDVDEIVARCERADVSPTGPLWGAPGTLADGEAGELEQMIADQYPDFRNATLAGGVTLQRRALRMMPEQCSLQHDASFVRLAFTLPSGSFATVLVHELFDVDDVSQRSRT